MQEDVGKSVYLAQHQVSVLLFVSLISSFVFYYHHLDFTIDRQKAGPAEVAGERGEARTRAPGLCLL